MEEHKFASFKELGEIAGTLDSCRREPSWFKNTGTGTFEQDPKRRDIMNLDTGLRAAVVSDRYHEYQHRDVIQEIANSFNHAKIEGHGYVYDNGDRIMCAAFFDNITAIKDPTSDKGIKVGAMFKNSYNKANSVTGSGYFMRIACLNQMYFGNLIHELKFSERHTGSIIQELPKSIQEFTDNLLIRSKLVAKNIEIAATVNVSFKTREQRLQTLQTLVDHTKIGEKIDDQLKGLEVTKWDIYNAITAVTSHERMGDTIKDKIERTSEKVLSASYTIIPAVLV
jgi:hypothetical protein